MKNVLIAITLCLIISCGSNDKRQQVMQSDKDSSTINSDSVAKTNINKDSIRKDSVTDPIALIKEKVAHINTEKLEAKHTEFMCDEKMMVDRFYENGVLVKISVDFATIGDVYAREDYYYDKGKLIFKYEFTEGGPACEGCIKKNEYRSYILNNKVIKYMKDKTVQPCRTCVFESRSKEIKLLTANNDDDIKGVLCK